jgi:hypothetical protein
VDLDAARKDLENQLEGSKAAVSRAVGALALIDILIKERDDEAAPPKPEKAKKDA